MIINHECVLCKGSDCKYFYINRNGTPKGCRSPDVTEEETNIRIELFENFSPQIIAAFKKYDITVTPRLTGSVILRKAGKDSDIDVVAEGADQLGRDAALISSIIGTSISKGSPVPIHIFEKENLAF